MHTVILAGGEGTRLRPITCRTPKPMVRLFDEEVLRRILRQLAAAGIRHAWLTLRFLPGAVRDVLQDEACGVALSYFIEERSLGTAGGVRMCCGAEEPVLVVSGDGVFDLDLEQVMRFHREKEAAATLVLAPRSAPTEFGVVETGPDGRIRRFLEKPRWESVVSDLVNTGIYLLSPGALAQIPENTACDFGRDLFPRLTERGLPLYGFRAEGYWCDVGTPAALVACAGDILTGRCGGGLPVPPRAPGVYAAEPVPEGVRIIPPVYIGRGVALGRGAVVGPCAALGAGSRLAPGARVRQSVLDGAFVGRDAEVSGSYLCRDSRVEENAILEPGCVLGPGAAAERDSLLCAGTRLWPGCRVPAGQRAVGELREPGAVSPPLPDGRGRIAGPLSGSYLTALGSALAAALPAGARLGAAREGTPEAEAGLMCLVAAAALSGCPVTVTDAPFPACAAGSFRRLGLEAGVFFSGREGDGGVQLFSPGGAPPEGAFLRKLAGLLVQSPAPGTKAGEIVSVTGCGEETVQRLSARFRQDPPRPLARVEGRGPENRLLRAALERAGYLAADPAGAAAFTAGDGGFSLTARDESGAVLDRGRLLGCGVLAARAMGFSAVLVGEDAPALLEDLADREGAALLRTPPTAGGAEPAELRDAMGLALVCCAWMAETGLPLAELARRCPPLAWAEGEIPSPSGRARTMEALTGRVPDPDTRRGLLFRTDRGAVRVFPRPDREALRVVAEAATAEAAEELCAETAQLVKNLWKDREKQLPRS